MTRLEHLEECMRGQFIWDRSGLKVLQTDETFEGSKDIARLVFVGLADMYGFQATDVQDYLEMEYDSYRSKLQQFRSNWKEVVAARQTETVDLMNAPLRKFNNKVCLCLNSIKWTYRLNPYLKLEDWIDHE